MSFGEDLWASAGRDGEGPWTDNKFSFDGTVTITKAGDYYLDFESESEYTGRAYPGSGPSQALSNIKITVRRQRGSGLMLY